MYRNMHLLFLVLAAIGLSTTSGVALSAGLRGPVFVPPTKAAKFILVDDVAPPVPVPGDAANVTYDGDSGALMFETATGVKDLAEFYRDALKKLGWQEQPSVINNDNMVQLDFTKGEASVDLTLMTMGDHTQVTGVTDGLASGSASGDDAENGATVLTFTDKDGLPSPNESVSSGTESTIFRHSISATVAAKVAVVVDMYRKELAAKGWTELPDKTKVDADSAFLVFDTPNGPATLTVKRDGSDTTLQLGLSDKAAASKSPLFPKPGQVKFALGNFTDNAVTVKIGGKSVKVPAGAGTKAPDGPMLDVAPGSIKAAMQGVQTETIEAGPDQIWMVMVGPGGLLPVQAY